MINKQDLLDTGWKESTHINPFGQKVLYYGKHNRVNIWTSKTGEIFSNIISIDHHQIAMDEWYQTYEGKCSNLFQLRFIMGLLGIQSFTGAELLDDIERYSPIPKRDNSLAQAGASMQQRQSEVGAYMLQLSNGKWIEYNDIIELLEI